MRIPAVMLLICLGIVTACRCSTSGALGTRPAPPDTVRGLVVVAGASPGVVLVRMSGGAELILLQGPADISLRTLESLEIFAAGTMRRSPRGRTLTGVHDFAVIADSGRPTRDGRLVTRGDLLTIVDADDRASAIVDPPAELQHHVGDRVWVAGGVTERPTAFGVIRDVPTEPGPIPSACSPSRIEKGGGRG